MSRHTTFNSSLKTSSQRASQKSFMVDENQRALDRISYLGGIPLPLPIVASILSMGDTFGPTGSMFYIFWAVSVPLAAAAVLVIYADTIRKTEIWIEVAAEHVAAARTQSATPGTGAGSSSHEKVDMAPFSIDIDRTETINLRRQGNINGSAASNGVVPQRMNHAITFNVGHEEAVIDLPVTGGILDETAAADALGAEESYEEPQMILEQPGDGSKPKRVEAPANGLVWCCKGDRGILLPRRADDVPFGVVKRTTRDSLCLLKVEDKP